MIMYHLHYFFFCLKNIENGHVCNHQESSRLSATFCHKKASHSHTSSRSDKNISDDAKTRKLRRTQKTFSIHCDTDDAIWACTASGVNLSVFGWDTMQIGASFDVLFVDVVILIVAVAIALIALRFLLCTLHDDFSQLAV